MTREDAKDLTLSLLVVVVVLLLADNVWLHVKCARQADETAAVALRLETHINPPPTPGFTDKVKDLYEKSKAAAKRGYQSVKEKFSEKEKPADRPKE